MILPKFVYPGGALEPSRPPVKNVPVPEMQAIRADDYTTDGIGQWIVDRVDHFKNLQFEFVPADELVANWVPFMEYALDGNVFSYFPDKSSGTSEDYTLEDAGWAPTMNVRAKGGFYQFTLRMRLYVPVE